MTVTQSMNSQYSRYSCSLNDCHTNHEQCVLGQYSRYSDSLNDCHTKHEQCVLGQYSRYSGSLNAPGPTKGTQGLYTCTTVDSLPARASRKAHTTWRGGLGQSGLINPVNGKPVATCETDSRQTGPCSLHKGRREIGRVN